MNASEYVINIGGQASESLLIEGGAFANAKPSNIRIRESIIKTIPESMFGSNIMYENSVHLAYLGIETVQDGAFNGHNISINLIGNYITSISPKAFANGTILGRSCVDAEDFTVTIPFKTSNAPAVDTEFTCDTYMSDVYTRSCFVARSCYHNTMHFVGSDDLTVNDACCALGGGNIYGNSLKMDRFSPIFCRPRSMNSFDVVCMCTSSTTRYDLDLSECVSSCPVSSFWVASEHADEEYNIISEAGRCVPCPGMLSMLERENLSLSLSLPHSHTHTHTSFT